jgi:hypothetical protein
MRSPWVRASHPPCEPTWLRCEHDYGLGAYFSGGLMRSRIFTEWSRLAPCLWVDELRYSLHHGPSLCSSLYILYLYAGGLVFCTNSDNVHVSFGTEARVVVAGVCSGRLPGIPSTSGNALTSPRKLRSCFPGLPRCIAPETLPVTSAAPAFIWRLNSAAHLHLGLFQILRPTPFEASPSAAASTGPLWTIPSQSLSLGSGSFCSVNGGKCPDSVAVYCPAARDKKTLPETQTPVCRGELHNVPNYTS